MTAFEQGKTLCVWEGVPYAAPAIEILSIKRRMIRNACLGLMLSSFCINPTIAAENTTSVAHVTLPLVTQTRISLPDTQPVSEINPKRANFKQEFASQESIYLADWVVDSGDNQKMPFLILDKKQAKVFVFDASGLLRGAAPALLGLALGDDSIPGVGKMALSSIKPNDRTTPAGRFVASLGRDNHNKEILWVDYDAGIALHRVVTTLPKERRLQRLESNDPLEHRISYGCINVPIKFYENIVSPAFTGTNGIVYVLPDKRLVQEVFGSYDVENRGLEHKQIKVKPVSLQVASTLQN